MIEDEYKHHRREKIAGIIRTLHGDLDSLIAYMPMEQLDMDSECQTIRRLVHVLHQKYANNERTS